MMLRPDAHVTPAKIAKWMDGARAIDECDYLFVERIGESEELTLDILLVEAKAQAPIAEAKDDSDIERLKVGARPIEPDSTSRYFHLVFERQHMVSYTVSSESYGRYPSPPEEFTGKLFRIFSTSHLLEFTKRTSHASDEYPGKLFHYQVVCLNHVIDVISTGPPLVAVLSSPSAAAKMLASLGGTDPDVQDIPRRRPA